MSEEAKGSIPSGCVILDKNKKWIIQSCIGVTGTTESYLAASCNTEKTTESADVLINIEPYQNGCLSIEMQFYIENAIPDQIENWIKTKRIQDFGLSIPRLLGSGSQECNGKMYHFIVTKKYDIDLWTLFVENGRQFPEHTVYKLAIQIIRVLEYIHNKGYLHANIEGKHLLLDLATPSTLLEERCVYLTHFALASRRGDHDDSNKTGNGPVEYLSRDSYREEPTMRGDLEMLLYNMIRWFGHSLPWDNYLNDSSKVHQLKKDAFKDIFEFLQKCFLKSKVPVPITEFARLLSSMNASDKPEYTELKNVFVKELKNLYHAPNGRLQWKVDKIVHESDEKISEQYRKDECIPGIHVSIKCLARIISENCRNWSEVDLQSTEPGSLLDIINRLTTIRKAEEWKIKRLQRAWQKDHAKLKTKVCDLWKRKGICINSALVQKNLGTNEDTSATSAGVNTDALSYSSARASTSQSHLSSTGENETPLLDSSSTASLIDNYGIDCRLSLPAKTVNRTKTTQRKRKYGKKPPWDKKPKRNRKVDLADETSEDKDDVNRQRPTSLSPSTIRNASNGDTTRFDSSSGRALTGARSAAIFQSNRDFSPVSRCSSSGFSSRPSTQGDDFHSEGSLYSKTYVFSLDQWLDKYKWLNNWLDLKDENLKVLGQFSSEPQTFDRKVQRLRILRDEFSEKQQKLDCWVEVRSKMPKNSAQELNHIERRWQDQLASLEGHGQKLFDALFEQLHDTLNGISSELDKLTLDRGPREQLLHKVKNFADQLEIQQTLLADIKAMGEELCQIFINSTLSNDVPVKIHKMEELYRNLHQKIESGKFDFDKNFSNRDQFDDSCKEILLWLEDKLADMSEKVLISTDRVPEQFEQHETFHQHVMSRETEMMELLKKGREDLARSQNAESRIIQQRYLDLIQAKWDRLKKRSLETLKNLQTCFNLGEKYHQGQVRFSPWLKKIEDKLDSFKLIFLKQEDDIEKQLNELSVLNNEVSEKSDELKQIINFGDTFVRSCDIDKDDQVKNEVTALKDRWDKLNKGLLERMQSLKDTSEEFVDLNGRLHCLKAELKMYENELASQNVLKRSALDPKMLDRIKELRDKTVSLREPIDTVHQQAKKLTPKAHKRGIDVSNLLDEVLTIKIDISNLNSKLVANYDGIVDHNFVRVKKEQEGKVDIIDLSSDEDEVDSPQSPQNETLRNDEQILNAAESKIDIKDEPLEKVNDADSSFNRNPSMLSSTIVSTFSVNENDDRSRSPKTYLGSSQIRSAKIMLERRLAGSTTSQNSMEEQMEERRKSPEETS